MDAANFHWYLPAYVDNPEDIFGNSVLKSFIDSVNVFVGCVYVDEFWDIDGDFRPLEGICGNASAG